MLPMEWLSAIGAESNGQLSDGLMAGPLLRDSRKRRADTMEEVDSDRSAELLRPPKEFKKRKTKKEYARLKTVLLSQTEKMELQSHAYGPDERQAFEEARSRLRLDVEARETGTNDRDYNARELSYEGQTLSNKTIAELGNVAAQRVLPLWIFRVASHSGGRRHTNGHDELTVHLPAAEKNDDHSCALTLVAESDLIAKIGRRALWLDRRWDPTLSWTPSLLFVLVLGTARAAKGEKEISIYLMDTDNATTTRGQPQGGYFHRRPAEFHFLPDLLRILNIQAWKGWKDMERFRLRRPWFTGEWLSHHRVECGDGDLEADLPSMITSGLYELLPQLKTKDDEDMTSLYHRCVRARSIGHSKHMPARPFTPEQLRLADKLGRCFMTGVQMATNSRPIHAPLLVFLGLLALDQRPAQDPLFMDWIRSRYTSAELENLQLERTTRVANNLPEIMQTLSLARDASVALDALTISPTKVWPADPDFGFDGKWTHRYPKEIKIKPKPDQAQKDRRKAKAKKRKEEEEAAKKAQAEEETVRREPAMEASTVSAEADQIGNATGGAIEPPLEDDSTDNHVATEDQVDDNNPATGLGSVEDVEQRAFEGAENEVGGVDSVGALE